MNDTPLSVVRTRPGPILLAAVLATAMGFIDNSVTALALPAIRARLGASQAQAEWVGAAYLLFLSSAILCGGGLGDRFGALRLFRGGIWGFIICSGLCALAPSPAVLIAARAAQGLAAAAMVPGSLALIAKAYPREQRGRALGLWAAASAATTTAGPVVGGAILTAFGTAGWRLIFALNLPLGGVALGLLALHVRPDAGKPGTPVDFAGAALAVASLGALSFGLSFERFWLLLPSALAMALFLWVEARGAAPMVPLSLFSSLAFAGVNAATLFLYFAFIGIIFYLPTVAMTGWGLTPLQVTAAMVPVSGTIALVSPWAGRMADRVGAGRMITLGAGLVALADLMMASLAGHGAFLTHVFPMIMMTGLGMGLVVAPLTAAVMANAPEDRQGGASGINNAVARVASLIGVALMGPIARMGYGAGGPGFGSTDPAPDEAVFHAVATSHAFAAIALTGAVAAAAAAGIAALTLRRSSPS